MKKFLTINGSKAWISYKDNLAEARHSAVNICDHSEEVLVREIDDMTDHTRVIIQNEYHDSLMEVDNRIDEVLELYGLTFQPSKGTSYHFLGGIFRGDRNVAAIYPKCFYIRDSSFALNSVTLSLIKDIQSVYNSQLDIE